MSPIEKGAFSLQGVKPSSAQGPDPAVSRVLKDGNKVVFRVLEALPENRYRILVREQPVSVQSRIPLEEGARYLAEIQIRGGAVRLLSSPIPVNLLPTTPAHGRLVKTPIASLLRLLAADTPLPAGFLTDCRTAAAVREAFLNCGLFYEARVREALRKGSVRPPADDLKGFLLRRAGGHPAASLHDTITAALKQIESRQFFCLQGGVDGLFPFWLPFGSETIIEGFVKRLRRQRGDGLLLTLRVPFLPAEELLLTVAWRLRRVDIRFSTGPAAYQALRNAAYRLEEQLHHIGLHGATVRVSRGIPKKLRNELEGIRFVESYG